jgi:integrase/recombinase XerD
MNVDELVTQCVAFRRTLGEKYTSKEVILRSFCRAVGPQTSITHIDAEAVSAFLNGRGSVTSGWFNKYHALKGLFQFAIRRGHLTEAPLPKVLPKHPPPFVPYIYTPGEIRQLLDAIPSSQYCNALIAPQTLRVMVLLLYGAALRSSEVLALTVADVDLPNALLTVRESKFFKSRLVPVGQQLAGVLAEYAAWRAASYPGDEPDRPFFLGRRGALIQQYTLENTFRRLTEHAGIRRTDGARYQPRLHDLRHSAAVHRLVRWYRQGANVQRLLYPLSVYLGHGHLRDTQVYLSMTADLLRQAGVRFEQYACGEDDHA